MITIHPIHDDEDHARAMSQVEQLWGAPAGTPEADTFEAKRHAVAPPDPIEAILFRMESQGLTRNDLIPMIGSRARVSEVLNKKRPLTLAMIQRLPSAPNDPRRRPPHPRTTSRDERPSSLRTTSIWAGMASFIISTWLITPMRVPD